MVKIEVLHTAPVLRENPVASSSWTYTHFVFVPADMKGYTYIVIYSISPGLNFFHVIRLTGEWCLQ